MSGNKILDREECFKIIRGSNIRRHDKKSMYRTLESVWTLDELTGLYNRRYFLEVLGLEAERVKRYGDHKVSALAISDVDYFKRINDEYGHLKGDEVLAGIGKTMKRSLRRADIAARYGGEEFAIIFPEINAENAAMGASRLRENLHNEFTDPKVTMSFGIVEITGEPELTVDDYIGLADSAMYRAKDAGGDKIHISGTTDFI